MWSDIFDSTFSTKGAIIAECMDHKENPRKIPRIPPTSEMKVIVVYFGSSLTVLTVFCKDDSG